MRNRQDGSLLELHPEVPNSWRSRAVIMATQSVQDGAAADMRWSTNGSKPLASSSKPRPTRSRLLNAMLGPSPLFSVVRPVVERALRSRRTPASRLPGRRLQIGPGGHHVVEAEPDLRPLLPVADVVEPVRQLTHRLHIDPRPPHLHQKGPSRLDALLLRPLGQVQHGLPDSRAYVRLGVIIWPQPVWAE